MRQETSQSMPLEIFTCCLLCLVSFIMIGGTSAPAATFRQYVAVERDQIIPSPEHLDDEHAAAWPLGGLTSWR